MHKHYLIISFGLLLLCGCNGSNQSNSGASTSTPKPALVAGTVKSTLDSNGTVLLVKMLNNYYALKNSMVATDSAKARETALNLKTATVNMQDYLKSDTLNMGKLHPFLYTIIAQSDAITTTVDKTCERQRIFFGVISNNFFALMKNTDIKNAGIYKEHCPMAFNEKGADWLSDDPDIKNPYFGKKMLECGEVTDSIK